MDVGSFSRTDALRFGWETFKRNLGPSIGLGLVGLAVVALLNGISGALEARAALSAFFTLLTQVVEMVLSLVWIRFALHLHDDRTSTAGLGLKAAVPSWIELLDYIAVSLLLGFMVSIGLLLLVIPGLYVAVRYGLAGFLVADHRRDVLGAFHESSELTRGERWNLFLFGLILAGINLLGAMLLGFGLLLTVPISVFAGAYVYRRLLARAAQERFLHPPPAPIPA